MIGNRDRTPGNERSFSLSRRNLLLFSTLATIFPRLLLPKNASAHANQRGSDAAEPPSEFKIYLPTVEGNKEVKIIKHEVTTADGVLQKLAKLAAEPKVENTINQIILLPTEDENPYVFNQPLVIPDGVWVVGDVDGSKDNLEITFKNLQADSAIKIKSGGGVERLNIILDENTQVTNVISATGDREDGLENTVKIVRVDFRPSDESTISGAMISVEDFLSFEITNITATNVQTTIIRVVNSTSGTIATIHVTTESALENLPTLDSMVDKPIISASNLDSVVINGLNGTGFPEGVSATGDKPTDIRISSPSQKLPISEVIRYFVKNLTGGSTKITTAYNRSNHVEAIVISYGQITIGPSRILVRLKEGNSPFPLGGEVTAEESPSGQKPTIELFFNSAEVSNPHLEAIIQKLTAMGFEVMVSRNAPLLDE